MVIHGGPDVGHGYLVPGFAHVERHVVLFDFRGCGRSTRGLPDDRLQPEYVVEDTRRLIEELDLGQVDLLGFSTGGRAAMQFVDKHPSLVRRLVLASTSAYDARAAEEYLTDWPEYQRRQRLATPEERNSTIFVWDLTKAPAYLDLLESLGDEGDWSYERAMAGLMHPWCPGDPETILRDFAKPILILHGAKDMGFPVQLAERLHAAVPNEPTSRHPQRRPHVPLRAASGLGPAPEQLPGVMPGPQAHHNCPSAHRPPLRPSPRPQL